MLALKLWQFDAKLQMSEKLYKNKDTELLIFKRSQLKERLHKGSEIDWNNKRYDVIAVNYTKDSVFITANHDKHETNILRKIDLIVKNYKGKTKNPIEISMLNILLFAAPMPNAVLLCFMDPVNQPSHFYYLLKDSESHTPLLLPPPKA